MNEWNEFLEKALEAGFSVGMKWGIKSLTFTLFSPSGKRHGRGVKINPLNWESALLRLADSGMRTIQSIQAEDPAPLVQTGVQEAFMR